MQYSYKRMIAKTLIEEENPGLLLTGTIPAKTINLLVTITTPIAANKNIAIFNKDSILFVFLLAAILERLFKWLINMRTFFFILIQQRRNA